MHQLRIVSNLKTHDHNKIINELKMPANCLFRISIQFAMNIRTPGSRRAASCESTSFRLEQDRDKKKKLEHWKTKERNKALSKVTN
jgi:hypothetical protein